MKTTILVHVMYLAFGCSCLHSQRSLVTSIGVWPFFLKFFWGQFVTCPIFYGASVSIIVVSTKVA